MIILTILAALMGCVQQQPRQVSIASRSLPMRTAVSAAVGDLNGNPSAEINGTADLASLLSFFSEGETMDDTTYHIGAGEYQARFRMPDGTELGVVISSSVWETHNIQGQMRTGWREYFTSKLNLKGKDAQHQPAP
jgi:hypothetical protein